MYGRKERRVAAGLLICAVMAECCRFIGGYGEFIWIFRALMRSVIYMGIFLMWGKSFYSRIIQKRIRNYLLAEVFLIIFWIYIRTVKWELLTSESSPVLLRYIWYSYYIPMLFIPLLFFLISLSIGKTQNERISWKVNIPACITTGLVLLVMTNDLHQFVFIFTTKTGWSDHNYTHYIGYWLIVVWDILLALAALGILFTKCRIPHSRKIRTLPLLPIAAAIIYTVLYVAKVPIIRLLSNDVAVVLCLCFAAVLESCICCRLIPSNMNYDELFRISEVPVCIADSNGKLFLASDDVLWAGDKRRLSAVEKPFLFAGHLRISGFPMKAGNVFWQDDLSELFSLMEELKDVKERLEDNNEFLRQEYVLRSRRQQLEEQNHLYDIVQEKTKDQIDCLSELIRLYEKEKEETGKKKILGRMAVSGTYLKRRSNLVFVAAAEGQISPMELTLCFRETLDNLTMYGVEGSFRSRLQNGMSESRAALLYDFFERLIENNQDDLSVVMIQLYERMSDIHLIINVETKSGRCQVPFLPKNAFLKKEMDEDGAWQLELTVGGEEKDEAVYGM